MDSKLRILLLGDAASVHMQRWAEALAGLGHAVCVASFRHPVEPPSQYRAEVVDLRGLGKLGYLLAPFQWKGLINSFRPDIVHAHHITSYGFVGSFLGFQPYFLTSWGSDVLLKPSESFVYRWMTKRACRKSGRVFSLAPHMTAALGALGVPESKVVTRPFGVDLSRFTARPDTARPAFSAESPLVVFSNRNFHGVYDVGSVLRGVRSAAGELPRLELWIAGEGPLESELKSLSASLGMTGCVKFLGRVSKEEMVKRLHAADIFVSSALSDGNNISLCEAMACGVVPVATDIVANTVWLKNGSNGFLYKPGDADALGSALKLAVAAFDRWPAIRGQNRLIIEERGSWRRSVEEVERIYLEFAGRASTPGPAR